MFGKWRFRDRIIIILYKCRDVSCGVAFVNPSGPMKVVMFVYIFASNKGFFYAISYLFVEKTLLEV